MQDDLRDRLFETKASDLKVIIDIGDPWMDLYDVHFAFLIDGNDYSFVSCAKEDDSWFVLGKLIPDG